MEMAPLLRKPSPLVCVQHTVLFGGGSNVLFIFPTIDEDMR